MSAAGQQMTDAVERVLKVCERVFIVLANLLLAAMLVANMANITARAVFDVSIKWTFPWSMAMFTYVVFLGFFIFVRRGKDVTIDFIFNRFPGQGRRVLAVLLNIVALVVLGVILSRVPAIVHVQVGVVEMVGIQRYMLSAPLFVSCLLIFIQVLTATVDILRGSVPPQRGIHTVDGK